MNNNHLQKILANIPTLLSSQTSILIYIVLFVYLVVWGTMTVLIPALTPYMPSEQAQLILGNYTNVLSALGASISAGVSVQTHRSMKSMHQRHIKMQASIEALHQLLEHNTQHTLASHTPSSEGGNDKLV